MRYNIFYKIHKGLRAFLYETGIEIQRTDFNNGEEVEATFKSLFALVDFFDKHAYHEDTSVFTAIEKYEPSVVDLFEKEHIMDHELTEKLRTYMSMYTSIETEKGKIEFGSAVRKTFVEFLVFNLNHMAKEEDIINNLLWRYLDDEAILAIEHQIVASQKPEDGALGVKWMLRGLSTQEIIVWLKVVQKNAPEFIFNALFEAAEKELPSTRFRQVVEGLTEGVMLA